MKVKSEPPYCHVNQKRILAAEPEFDLVTLNGFMWFIKERYKIHIAKDVLRKPAPWTSDKILQGYRFSNVKREHDKQTRWLIANITDNDFLTYRQKLLNCVLFRMFNKWETMEIIGAPFKFEGRTWTFVPAQRRLREHMQQHPHFNPFSSTFSVAGLKCGLREVFTEEQPVQDMALRYMKRIADKGLIDYVRESKDQYEVFTTLNLLDGIGSSTAYQIFLDFTYIKEFPFTQDNFVYVNQSAKKGLKAIFKDRDHLTDEECVFWLRDNWDDINKKVERFNRFTYEDMEDLMIDLKHYERCMNICSIQKCLGEFNKWLQSTRGEGMPRRTYTKGKGKK